MHTNLIQTLYNYSHQRHYCVKYAEMQNYSQMQARYNYTHSTWFRREESGMPQGSPLFPAVSMLILSVYLPPLFSLPHQPPRATSADIRWHPLTSATAARVLNHTCITYAVNIPIGRTFPCVAVLAGSVGFPAVTSRGLREGALVTFVSLVEWVGTSGKKLDFLDLHKPRSALESGLVCCASFLTFCLPLIWVDRSWRTDFPSAERVAGTSF